MFTSLLFSIFMHLNPCVHKSLSTSNSLNTNNEVLYNYNQSKVLNSFVTVLDELKKHYNFTDTLIHYSLNENKPVGFFIYDLSDTLNNSKNKVVNFKEGHIYHFAPRDLYFSYSSFCFLLKGKLVFFKAVN